jgi:hypothetical protein
MAAPDGGAPVKNLRYRVLGESPAKNTRIASWSPARAGLI